MPFNLDVFSTVHLGRLRTGPPATGAEPQRDDLLRANIGRYLIDDGLSFVGIRDDKTFHIVKTADETFHVAKTGGDEVML